MSDSEFKLELGIFLCSKNILTMGKASEFVGLPKAVFQKKLAERDITISYDEQEFQKDLAAIRKTYGDL
jgi:predicted HTH domain antitoxin